MDTYHTEHVLDDVYFEREAQDRRFGEQNLPDGINRPEDHANHVLAKLTCENKTSAGCCTWRDVLTEELCEAYDARTENELRMELKQVAAVAVAWIEALDRRDDKRKKLPVTCDFADHAQTD